MTRTTSVFLVLVAVVSLLRLQPSIRLYWSGLSRHEKSRTCYGPAYRSESKVQKIQNIVCFVWHLWRCSPKEPDALDRVFIQVVVQSVDGLHQLTPLMKNLFRLKLASFIMTKAAFTDVNVFIEHRQAV